MHAIESNARLNSKRKFYVFLAYYLHKEYYDHLTEDEKRFSGTRLAVKIGWAVHCIVHLQSHSYRIRKWRISIRILSREVV